MSISRSARASAYVAAVFLVVMAARPAAAQYAPRYSPTGAGNAATGETYHVEVQAGLWDPSPDMVFSSEGLGILPTSINGVTDLGFTQTRFPDLRLVLRPAKKHKFLISYIPIKYQATATLTRDIVFNGIRYSIGVPVTSTLDWKAWEFGYEYDFLYRPRWFVGVIAEAKYTQVTATLSSPIDTEYTQAKAPIPAVGGIVRVYVLPNISITGKATGFKLPGSIRKGDSGQYIDVDVYGTLNFTDHIGAMVGYHSLDVQYQVQSDSGDFTLRGLYFGGVVRF
ncbi:MAG TPA: hypothetical protein VNE16_13310 [Vicinamibacterales bacterium]|nr:hypothetical protein [Vicinamibacterales bacterium]